VAEEERDPADDPEDDEMQCVVLEVRIEVRPKQKRDQADQRQQSGDHKRSRACTLSTETRRCSIHRLRLP
jgi:hypothetical protein